MRRGVTASPQSVLIIRNARGSRRPLRAADALASALERAGVTAEVFDSRTREGARQAVEARQAGPKPVDALIAAGGDGTARATADLCARHGLPLGLAPWGVGNYLAGELRIPGSPERAAAVIAAGLSVPIALGRANDEAFILMAGVGLDSAAVAAIPSGLKAANGSAAYAAALTTTFVSWRAPALRVEIDGGTERCGWFVATNARFRDRRLTLGEGETPRLHALLIDARNPVSRADVIRRFAMCDMAETGAIRTIPFQTARLTAPSSRASQLDGDAAGSTPLTLRADPTPLRVFAPRR